MKLENPLFSSSGLDSGEKFSVYYHSIFLYPLNESQIIKWKAGEKSKKYDQVEHHIQYTNGNFHIKGQKDSVYRKLKRERVSARKLKIGEKASRAISLIPFVKMVGLTGSVAVKNANESSDIDFLIITAKNTLWITRPVVYLVLLANGIKIRYWEGEEKDRICLNMWLDEGNMVIRQKNFYTAHEIAQVIPLYQKNATYKKFIAKNIWVREYWPNAVKHYSFGKQKAAKSNIILSYINKLCFRFQRMHMQGKITKERVGLHKAFFHPRDYSEIVLEKLKCLLTTKTSVY